MRKEYKPLMVSISRVVVAVIFAMAMITHWISEGVFPQGPWVVFGIIVILWAEVTNLLDYKICKKLDIDVDNKYNFLLGRSLREAMSCCDIFPLWAVGVYIGGRCVIAFGFWATIYVGIFVATTIIQVFGLPKKHPVLSTFLGRFVPVGLSLLSLWFYYATYVSWPSPVFVTLIVSCFVIGIWVAIEWEIGVASKE